MKHNAQINFRNGGFYLTQIDTDINTPQSIASRMTSGGFLICEDDRCFKPRTLIINLGDVSSVEIEGQA